MGIDVIVLNNLGGGQSCEVDRLPLPGETVKGYNWKPSIDAGKGPNSCIAMGRLGIRPAFIGKCGRDPAGDRGEAWMREAGVDTSGLLRSDEIMTGQGIRVVEKSGNNLIVCGESSSRALTVEEVERELERLAPAKYFYGGFEIRSELTMAGLAKAKVLGMTTVVNLSPVPEVRSGFSCADIIVINETEAAAVLGLSSWKDLPPEELAAAARNALGCGAVIITLGADGSIGLDSGGFWRTEPVAVNCVDSSGAGDAFLSGMIVSLVRGHGLRDATSFAGAFAALTTTRKGTLPSYPEKEEALSFIRNTPGRAGI